MLAVVTALISLALTLADGLGTPVFLVLITAELLVVLAMGALTGGSLAKETATGAEAAQLRQELAALEALEPLGAADTNGTGR